MKSLKKNVSGSPNTLESFQVRLSCSCDPWCNCTCTGTEPYNTGRTKGLNGDEKWVWKAVYKDGPPT